MAENSRSQQETVAHSMEDQDFPSLYRSADQASLSAQRRFLRLQGIHIWCLILGSIVAALGQLAPAMAVKWVYMACAAIVALGFCLTLMARVRRDDRVWFDCRAIAESSKTATWRFMTKAPPFTDDNTAEKLFTAQLKGIREARPNSAKDLASSLDRDAKLITDFMTRVRRESAENRRRLYLQARLRDQKVWYVTKAELNSKKESCWSHTTMALQGAAVLLAVIWASSGLPAGLVPILTTCAASSVAWSQMKRYSELAKSYSLAGQELGEQEALAPDGREEASFLEFVDQVEYAISREHTMWCGRREVIAE